MDVLKVANKVLRVKGNLLRISFEVDGKNYQAFVPDDELFGAVKDVLLNREYEYLPEFELNRVKGKRVVDAGAHVGLFSLVASTFADEVIAIEPHPINFRLLQLNTEINAIQNIVLINRALVGQRNNKSLVLYEGEHSGAHTVLEHLRYISKSSKSIKRRCVSSISLGDIIQSYGEIDLLKMDIEGCEFEVLTHSNSTNFDNIKKIVVECHLRAGNINYLETFLKKKGYETKIFAPPLIKQKAGYRINVKDLVYLKIFMKIVYLLSNLIGVKNNGLAILFAIRR
jgi:FkbM family methyltransferase